MAKVAFFKAILKKRGSTLFACQQHTYNNIDGRKDASQLIAKIDGEYHQNVLLEEHYVVVGEPGEFYLSHVRQTDGLVYLS